MICFRSPFQFTVLVIFKTIAHTHTRNARAVVAKQNKYHYFIRLVAKLLSSVLEREREMFYLTTHSTHFIYGYLASGIWLRTILIAREETRCRHMGYSFRLAARVLLYAPSHRQDSTYHGLCYTSRGALVGTRNTECFK